MRLAPAAALALVLAATPTAVAAPKATAPWCIGVTDAAGDAALLGAVGAGPALDVLSADAAAGRTEVVVVLRLPTTDTSDDTLRAAGGYEWEVTLTADGLEYVFGYRVNSLAAGGSAVGMAQVGSSTPPVTVSVQPTAIVWRVKRGDLPKPGPRSAWVEMHVASSAAGSSADTASGRAPRSACR